ncbi:hypothetical protein QFC24_006247 [Naganishia onofrii]|uniref:Uncharacterized protein n=1 Tax=Naganishia onofrii TaxID=1851511 RepID=A0ACC2X311_9TREE|nr:hypothetical protein QFC24_006247 [Naganishia onofrii]
MDILNRPHFSRNATSHSVTPSTSSPDDQYMRILAEEAYARRYPPTPSGRSIAGSSYRTFGVNGSGGGGGGLTEDQYRILGEFQRVVYGTGGRSLMVDDDEHDEQEKDGVTEVDATGRKQELRTFLDQHFEADCVYESPLITLQSRPLIFDALTLSSDLASSRLPSIYPRALLQHSGNIARWGIRKLFGSQSKSSSSSSGVLGKGKDVESAQVKAEQYAGGRVEQIARALVPWLPLSSASAAESSKNGNDAAQEGWWEIWHVSSECTELGGFETWHGCHTGIIDHTITLKLLPSLLGITAEPSQTTTPYEYYSFAEHQTEAEAGGTSTFTSPAPSTAYLPSHYATSNHQHPLLRLRTRTRAVPVPPQENGSTLLLPVVAIQKALATMLTFQLRVCGVLIAGLGRVFGSSASNEERPSWERERGRERKGKEKAGAGLYSHQLALQDAAAATAVLEGKILVPVPSVREVVSNNVYPGLPLKIQQLSAPPVATQQLTQQAQQPRTHSNVLGLQEAWSPLLPRPTFHPTSAALVQTQPQTQTETTTDFTAPDVDRGGEATDH